MEERFVLFETFFIVVGLLLSVGGAAVCAVLALHARMIRTLTVRVYELELQARNSPFAGSNVAPVEDAPCVTC